MKVMTSFHHLKSIIGRSFADFREYFSPADFSFYFLLAMYFIIDITRIKYFPMATNAQKLIFEIGASILLLPFSSMVIADIILIRKSRDLSMPKENLFNNTLTFMLTSIVAMLIAVYEEGEGWYPFRRSVDLIGKEKFLMVFGGLLFLSLIQLIPGSIPYSDNLYLPFFIGVFKAIFFSTQHHLFFFSDDQSLSISPGRAAGRNGCQRRICLVPTISCTFLPRGPFHNFP